MSLTNHTCLSICTTLVFIDCVTAVPLYRLAVVHCYALCLLLILWDSGFFWTLYLVHMTMGFSDIGSKFMEP